jgi:hypothetical protein
MLIINLEVLLADASAEDEDNPEESVMWAPDSNKS